MCFSGYKNLFQSRIKMVYLKTAELQNCRTAELQNC
jgi:hypothetical protein